MYKTMDEKKDLATDIHRHIAPFVKRIEALENAASNKTVADALSLLSDLFSETAHETWTKGEVVEVIEDFIEVRCPASSGQPQSPPVAWRYKCHDGQFVFMETRLTDEQKSRGYYRDEDYEDIEDEDGYGPFFWSNETPLYADTRPLRQSGGS